MKKTTPKKAYVGILQAAAAVLKDSLSPSGAAYRLSDFMAKMREILQQRKLRAKVVLTAMKDLIKFNNRNLHVTPKGARQLFRLMPT